MDREKYPNYFLAVVVLYAIMLLASIGYFVLPSLSFALDFADFYFLLALIFLPLVLLVVYEKDFLKGKESAMRALISALVVVNFVVTAYLMLLIA